MSPSVATPIDRRLELHLLFLRNVKALQQLSEKLSRLAIVSLSSCAIINPVDKFPLRRVDIQINIHARTGVIARFEFTT